MATSVDSSVAAKTWRQGVYKRVNQRMKLLDKELEEELILLRSMISGLRCLGKHLLVEKHD